MSGVASRAYPDTMLKTGFMPGSGKGWRQGVGWKTYRYKTEAGFLAAMKRLGDRVLWWIGDDHCWIIKVRR